MAIRHPSSVAMTALVVSICFILFTSVAQGTALPRGAHPAEAELYSGTTFTCKDGSKAGLPLSRVNDDYCDCADGSDEPGTSACPNGRFLCRNIGHAGVSLFSSRVNDGICDCCDGSDEYDGKVQCSDTCYSLGEETRAAKRQEVEAIKKGLEIRNQYIEQAQAIKQEKKNKLAQRQADISALQQEKDALQSQVDELEGKAKAAKELLAKYKPREGAVVEEEETYVSQPPLEIPEGEIINDEEEDDEDDEDDDDMEEASESPKEELLERTEDVREALEQAEKDVADYNMARKLIRRDKNRGREGDESNGLTSLLRSVRSFIGLGPSASPSVLLSGGQLKMSDLRELRIRLSEAERKLEEARSEVVSLEDYLRVDLGDDAYHGIRDQTFELHTNQYTYKLTPFKEVKQQYTRLGDWRHWLNSEHTHMEYAGGERCWNGPDRKTIVHVSCGETNKILSVEEPNKCEYLMEFTTPAACSPDLLARLESELSSLENPTEAVLPPLNTKDIF